MDIKNKFSTRKLTLLAIFFVVAASSGLAQTTPNVVLGQNGIKMNVGTLDINGNDIEDAGTTIWDQSAGQISTSVIDYSAATASDVGLGNVQNEAQVAEDGDTMSGVLNMNGNVIKSDEITADFASGQDMFLEANGNLNLRADQESSNYECTIASSDGSWTCDGTKSWRHEINDTHNAIYTSQESAEVRAVYEGESYIDGETKIKLPEHFSQTVSDKKPVLRATSTVQGELAYSSVIEKTDDYIIIDSSKPANVNFRITGVREGWEDHQVIVEK